MCVSMLKEAVPMTAPCTAVTESFRCAVLVQNTWNVKTAKPLPTTVLINRTGGSTMTPINVSLSRRTATRVKVTSTFLVCSVLHPVIHCDLNITSRDPFLHSGCIFMIFYNYFCETRYIIPVK